MQKLDCSKRIDALEGKVKKLEQKLSSMKYYGNSRNVEPVEKHILSAKEAAAYLGMGKDGLRGLTFKKQIPYYRPNGKNIYFDVKDLDAWLMRNRQEAMLDTGTSTDIQPDTQ